LAQSAYQRAELLCERPYAGEAEDRGANATAQLERPYAGEAEDRGASATGLLFDWKLE